MAGNDVRVRLSAEGIAEVQRALRTIQRDSDRVNRQSAASVERLQRGLAGFRRLLGGLGVGAGAAGLAALARNADDSADAIQKLQLRVGGTAEDLSALTFGTRTTATSFESLSKGLIVTADRLDKLRQGDDETTRQFRDLGLAIEDIEGLDAPQVFELISQRVAELENPLDRARIVGALFGRRLVELIPLMLDVANKGLGGLRESARGFGLEFSQALIDAAAASNDAIALIDARVDGLAVSFKSGFLPQFLGVVDDFTKGNEDMVEATRTAGDAIGRVLRVIIAGLAIPFNLIKGAVQSVTRDIAALTLISREVLTGNFSEAGELVLQRLSEKGDEIKGQFSGIADDFDRLLKAATAPPPAPPQRPPQREGQDFEDLLGGESESAQAATRRLNALRAGLEAERSVRDAARQRELAQAERALELNEISFEQFLERRRQLVVQAQANLEQSLQAQRDAIASAQGINANDRSARVAAIEAQLTASRIRTEQELEALQNDRIDRQRAAAQELLQVERELLQLEGSRRAAAEATLAIDSQRLRERLQAAGAGAAAIDAAVSRLQNATLTRLNFDDITEQATRALNALDNARTRIEQDVQLGITTQLGAQNRILQLEQARLPVLRQLAVAAREAAAATGDPALVEQAEELAQRIGQISVSVDLASNSIANFRDQAEQSAQNNLTNFLADGIQQADNLKDAFRQLALSIVNDLKRIAAQAIATSVVRGLSGAFGGGAAVPTNAAGGLLSGPGTGTSDSFLSWVSNGEYIVRAAAVARPGMRQHLDAINYGNLPKFATGGLVAMPLPRFNEGGLAEASGVQASPFTGRLELGLADGLELRESSVSEGVIIEAIRRNPRAVSEALGR